MILVVVAVAAGVAFYAGCGGGGDATTTTPVENPAKFWVSASEGLDTNSGSIERPFATVAKGVAAAVASGGTESVYVVAGIYHEDVVVGDAAGYYGIALYGGYGTYDAVTQTRPRDIVANLTVVDRISIDGSAGAPINGTEAIVDGFAVSQVSSLNASPVIKSNRITYDAPLCTSRAALLLSTTGAVVSIPSISENVIDNISCVGGIAEVVGLELSSAGTSQLKPQVRTNQITGGSGVTAATHTMGILGRAMDSSTIELALEGSTVSAGTAANYSAAVNIWADSATAGASLVALNNEVRGGTAVDGFGVDLGFDSISDVMTSFTMADIQRSKVFGGANCSFSAGISIAGATAQSSLTNNFVSAGQSTQILAFQEGIRLEAASADIINNTLVAETGDTAYMIDMVQQTAATKIENNILFVNPANAGGALVGIFEAMDSSPAVLKNNLFDDSLNLVYASDFGGLGDILTVADLVVAYPAYTANIEGASMLVDPTNLDLHISAGSAAVDMADATAAPTVDYDGIARPSGAAPDIGADEM